MKKMNQTEWHTVTAHTSCITAKCTHTHRSIMVWQSLFISIVCKFPYNMRSAAVLWPNKFNTTYAIGQSHTHGHSNLFTFIFLDDVSCIFFSTYGLKSSIKSNFLSTAWSTDIRMKKFEWKGKKYQQQKL